MGVFLLLSASATLSGCIVGDSANQDIANAFTPALPDPPSLPPPNPVAGCKVDRYVQPEAVITKKVDLLFLTDTSSSLDEERLKVAQGVNAFIQALPADVDYRVATMLAHGGASLHAGRIYSWQRTGNAKVLRSDLLTSAEIQTELLKDLTHVPSDNTTDGGEIGMYSLTRAMDDDRMAEARGMGFFREDAALAVITISDENDICSIFPEGVTPVPDPQGSEATAKAAYCTRTAPARMLDGVVMTPSYVETITPKSVVTKLQQLQGERPLVIAAIAYTDPTKVPAGGENEVDYGSLEMVSLSNGVKVEMTDASYESGLNQIGVLTSVKLSLKKEFSLTSPPAEVDPASIEVSVDGAPVTFTYLQEMNQVSLDTLGSPRSTVDIAYCEPLPEPDPSPTPSPTPTSTGVAGVDSICQAGSFVPKGAIRVGLSIDPAEGSMSNIVAGLTMVLGSAPTVYTDAQIAAGDLVTDGVTILILSRKVVVSTITSAYVQGVRDFIASGGSLIAEYDGAALLFDSHEGVTPAFVGHFAPSVGLFEGEISGGGLLIPTSFSTAFAIDSSHPVWMGVPETLETGLRAAFAVANYPSSWLTPIATYTASGTSGGMPAGSHPAVMVGRCGSGRVAIFSMNHFTVLSTNADVRTLVGNTVNWVAGQ